DRGADTDVGVGHQSHMTVHDREPGRLLSLANGARVNISGPGNEFVVDCGGHVTPSFVSSLVYRTGARRSTRCQEFGPCRSDLRPRFNPAAVEKPGPRG